MNQLQVVQHPVSKFIFMEGNQGVTDSLTVSQIFGKRHDNAMADIRSHGIVMLVSNKQLEMLQIGEYTKFGMTELLIMLFMIVEEALLICMERREISIGCK